MIVDITEKEFIQHPCIFRDERFSVYIEENSMGWLIHCLVETWKLSTYRDMLEVLYVLLDIAPDNRLYAISNNKKLTKFGSLFGMEVIDEMYTSEGKLQGEVLCLTL